MMKIENYSEDNYTELKALIRNYDITLIAFVLKRLTDRDHALSCSELTEQLNQLLFSTDSDKSFFDVRTTKRKLDIIEPLLSSENVLLDLNHIFASTYGGIIKYREADGLYNKKYPHKEGTQKRYYFEPLLEASDMDLIYGTLNSSRYLSDEEKDYLLARLEILHPSNNMSDENIVTQRNLGIETIKDLPARATVTFKNVSKTVSLPGNSSKLLRNVQIIHTAIENEFQIEVLYGIYDINEHTGKVDFHIRNKNNEPYILNPYALLWNDGEYYLVASDQAHENPTHYRVDRIIEVKPHMETNDDGYQVPAKRSKIPDILKEYYEKSKNGKVIFNGIKYANTHPSMAIRRENRIIDCKFECTNWSLQMLVDNFGPDIRIKKSTLPHNASEVDYNGNPQEFLIAAIRKVQFENAKRFAINNCQYLTIVEPKELVSEVKEVLEKVIKKLG